MVHTKIWKITSDIIAQTVYKQKLFNLLVWTYGVRIGLLGWEESLLT